MSSLSSFVRIRRLIPKQQLTRNAAAVKQTAVFTSGFGAVVEGSKSEYIASRDWSWDFERGRAFLKSNKRVRQNFPTTERESIEHAGTKLAERKVQF